MLEGHRSKASKNKIVNWLGGSPARLDQLVRLVCKATPRIQDRAAWPLTCYGEKHPKQMLPYLRRLTTLLRTETLHTGVKRSIVRLLQYVDIPKSLQGEVAAHCFRFLSDPSEAIAVRAFSITVLENLAMKNKDLQSELRIILEDQLPYGSAALVNRSQKVLKRLSVIGNR